MRNKYIILALLVGLFLSYRIKQNPKHHDFGLNLFTEILGVTFTVLIIDNLIKERDERQNYGPKYLAYKKINLLVSNYIWLWRDIHRSSVPKSEPQSIDGFFSLENINLIWDHLNLDKGPNDEAHLTLLTEEQKKFLFTGSYWEFIPSRLKKTKDAVLEISNRFGQYLEPEIYGKLNDLIEADYFKRLSDLAISKVSYDEKDKLANHFDKRPILKCWAGSNSRLKEADLKVILFLYDWCSKNRDSYYSKEHLELDNQMYKNFEYKRPLNYVEGTMKINNIGTTAVGRTNPAL